MKKNRSQPASKTLSAAWRRFRYLRVILVFAAMGFSLQMWWVNEQLPDQNRVEFNHFVEIQAQRMALTVIVVDLIDYGLKHPKFRHVLAKYPMRRLLDDSKDLQ